MVVSRSCCDGDPVMVSLVSPSCLVSAMDGLVFRSFIGSVSVMLHRCCLIVSSWCLGHVVWLVSGKLGNLAFLNCFAVFVPTRSLQF